MKHKLDQENLPPGPPIHRGSGEPAAYGEPGVAEVMGRHGMTAYGEGYGILKEKEKEKEKES